MGLPILPPKFSRYVGIDPGKQGAIAHLFIMKEGTRFKFVQASVYDLPYDDVGLQYEELPRLTKHEAVVTVERPQWRYAHGPNQAITPWFNYGRLSTRYPDWTEVAPATWKKALGLDKDKDKSRAMAAKLFPGLAEQLKRKKDDGRAEALLIAYYGSPLFKG